MCQTAVILRRFFERKSMPGRTIQTPIGPIGIWGEDGYVTRITFDETQEWVGTEPWLLLAEKELMEYFRGERKEFDFACRLYATGFQKKCLEALIKVRYGNTVSYGELAKMTGVPGGARAVGNAMHKNPLPILIPCHRVIRADGRIGGFGVGTEKKEILLKLEGGWQTK